MRLFTKATKYIFKSSLLLLLSFLYLQVGAQGNNLILISGNIIDQDTRQPLQGVSVQVKGTVSGTATDALGNFR